MAKTKKSKAEIQAELSQPKTNVEALQAEVTKETVSEAPAVAVVEKKKGPGKIAQILGHFKAGMSTKEIAKQFVLNEEGQPISTGEKDEAGNEVFETFHPTTISIQVNKYKRANPDMYPPQLPAKTKKEIAAEKKAAKEEDGAGAAVSEVVG